MDQRPVPAERSPEGSPERSDEVHADGATGDGTTGVAAVDRVLAEVAVVSSTPVSEHVAVFEQAHEQLRRALDAHPETPSGQQQGA